MRPITLQNKSLQKGPSSSADFNKLRDDIQTDITSLFNIVNTHEGSIAESMDHMLRENYFLQNRLLKLEGKVKELENDYQASSIEGESIMTRSFIMRVILPHQMQTIQLTSIHFMALFLLWLYVLMIK
ncbi:hypothetical protein AAAC51_07455 [Priestia megaterium]